MTTIISALFMNGLGISTLYLSWQRSSPSHHLTLLGWLLILSALYVWCGVKGVEFGSVYWLISNAIIAFITILLNKVYNPKSLKEKPRYSTSINVNQTLLFLKRLLVAGPLAGAASICLMLSITPLLWGEQSTQLVTSALLIPLCWAIACFWSCAAQKLITPTIVFTSIISISNIYFLI